MYFLSGQDPLRVFSQLKEAPGVSGFRLTMLTCLWRWETFSTIDVFSSEQGLAHGHEIMNCNNLCSRYSLLSSCFVTSPFLPSPRASEG